MTFSESLRSVFSKYATFAGRARRSEYWWFQLFAAGVNASAYVLDLALLSSGGPPFAGIATSLALALPNLAVTVRRLHDRGWSGWWLLTVLPPLVLVFLRGSDGENAYGPDPLADAGAESDAAAQDTSRRTRRPRRERERDRQLQTREEKIRELEEKVARLRAEREARERAERERAADETLRDGPDDTASRHAG